MESPDKDVVMADLSKNRPKNVFLGNTTKSKTAMSPPKKKKQHKNHHRKTKASKQTNKKTPTTAKQQFCKEKQQHE